MIRIVLVISILRWPALLVALLALTGCGPSAAPGTESGVTQETSDPDTGITLRTHVPSTELGIADRLTLGVMLEWPVAHDIELIEPDWSQGGWALIESTSTAPALVGETMRQERRYVLEPFLAGDYQTPTFSLRIAPQDAETPRTLESSPISITVATSLTPDAAEELSPLRTTKAPREETDQATRRSMLTIAGAGGALIACVVLVLVITRPKNKASSGRSIYDELIQIKRHPQTQDEQQAYHRLHQVFARLDPRLQSTSEIRELICACERARFAPGAGDAPSPQAMAGHTLELLGASEEGAA